MQAQLQMLILQICKIRLFFNVKVAVEDNSGESDGSAFFSSQEVNDNTDLVFYFDSGTSDHMVNEK